MGGMFDEEREDYSGRVRWVFFYVGANVDPGA